jgi:hypothetical protein
VIRPLRVLHRRAVIVLAVALPVLFALGLAARRGPRTEAPPAALLPPPAAEPVHATDLGALWPDFAVGAELGTDPADPGRLLLRLIPGAPVEAPDLLVYWAAAPAAAGRLPADAVLLGALAGTAPASYPLPAGAAHGGRLILYSLGWGRLLATAPLKRPGSVPADLGRPNPHASPRNGRDGARPLQSPRPAQSPRPLQPDRGEGSPP